MKKVKITKTKDCKTAEEFLDYLQIRRSRWLPKTKWVSPWIFRGHSDASWPLLPRTWRKDPPDADSESMRERFFLKNNINPKTLTLEAFLHFPPGGEQYFTWENYFQIHHISEENKNHLIESLFYTAAEVDAIHEFMDTADKLGYPIVKMKEFGTWKDVMVRHLYYGSVPSAGNGVFLRGFPIWDGRDHFAVALAQHHGIPTSLMDWTRKSEVAALFAADGVHANKSGYLAVWALNTDVLQNYDLDKRLYQVTIPQSELLYLHAQASLFIYDGKADEYFIRDGKWPDIESVLRDSASLFKNPPLRKITLPVEQADELLRLLWAEGISRAQLMPTYDNITTALKSKWKREFKPL